MSSLNLRAILLLASLALVGCASNQADVAQAEGIGGTGFSQGDDEGDGIGGTGLVAENGDEDGLGGTGLWLGDDEDGIGGTGVVGVITELGSIVVNDLHIELPADIELLEDGRVSTVEVLRVGQMVEVLVVRRNGELRATEVELTHPLVGPVTRTIDDTNTLEVFGQSVRVEPDTVNAGAAEDFAAGRRVQISGFRTPDGTVIATRIDLADKTKPDQISGVIHSIAGRTFQVGTTIIQTESTRVLAVGSIVIATVKTSNGRLTTRELTLKSAVPFVGRAHRYLIEGYAVSKTSSQLQLGQISARMESSSRAQPNVVNAQTAKRVRAVVRLDPQNHVLVERVVSVRPVRVERPRREAAPRPQTPPRARRPDVSRTRVRDAIPSPKETRPDVQRPPVDKPVRPKRPKRPGARPLPKRPSRRPARIDALKPRP